MRMNLGRLFLRAAGLALSVVGVYLLVDVRDLAGVLVWLGGAVALHDALIAPLVLLIGWVLVRGCARGPVRGALLVAGALTAVALPVLLRPGTPANSSVLPLDYLRNWLLALVGVAAVAALMTAARAVRRKRGRPPRQALRDAER